MGELIREEHVRCDKQRYNAYIQNNDLALMGTYSLLVRRERKAYADDIYF